METKLRGKRGVALVFAVLLVLSCRGLLKTQAAGSVDIDAKCSLTVAVNISSAVGGNDAYLEDFNQMEIPVSVYRVAKVDITGQRFEAVGAFEGLEIGQIEHGDQTASEWMELAKQAEELRVKMNPAADGEAVVKRNEGDAEGNASATIGELETGMYLVVPEATYNPDCTIQYQFAPYLTALPSSDYALNGEGTDGTINDAWVYDTTIGLKPDAVPQTGPLTITKALNNYNETLGPVTFVFEVVGRDGNDQVQYSEVVSLTFQAAEVQSVTLEGIPAGLQMTVTEVYSGASYEAVGGETVRTSLIVSDEGIRAGVGPAASVSFENQYGGGNRGGYGVTNHFDSDGSGGWTWRTGN